MALPGVLATPSLLMIYSGPSKERNAWNGWPDGVGTVPFFLERCNDEFVPWAMRVVREEACLKTWEQVQAIIVVNVVMFEISARYTPFVVWVGAHSVKETSVATGGNIISRGNRTDRSDLPSG